MNAVSISGSGRSAKGSSRCSGIDTASTWAARRDSTTAIKTCQQRAPILLAHSRRGSLRSKMRVFFFPLTIAPSAFGFVQARRALRIGCVPARRLPIANSGSATFLFGFDIRACDRAAGAVAPALNDSTTSQALRRGRGVLARRGTSNAPLTSRVHLAGLRRVGSTGLGGVFALTAIVVEHTGHLRAREYPRQSEQRRNGGDTRKAPRNRPRSGFFDLTHVKFDRERRATVGRCTHPSL